MVLREADYLPVGIAVPGRVAPVAAASVGTGLDEPERTARARKGVSVVFSAYEHIYVPGEVFRGGCARAKGQKYRRSEECLVFHVRDYIISGHAETLSQSTTRSPEVVGQLAQPRKRMRKEPAPPDAERLAVAGTVPVAELPVCAKPALLRQARGLRGCELRVDG